MNDLFTVISHKSTADVALCFYVLGAFLPDPSRAGAVTGDAHRTRISESKRSRRSVP